MAPRLRAVSGPERAPASEPRPKRSPSVAVQLLPATYVTMTAEQEDKAVAAVGRAAHRHRRTAGQRASPGALTSPAHGGLLCEPGKDRGYRRTT